MNSTTKNTWRAVTAIEAIRFCSGKEIDEARSEEHGAYGSVTRFTDGSALRIEVESGRVYSAHSVDPATISIEVSDA